ncbi:hypothetical protein GCM10023081_13170 [Arthrobacter ginkgonis]|uniref:Uncharacterized protein n=1 Tax=Arthrobacter ginkgonis TaxID=1630594 RepID=A0ABP7C5L6_9MICC
MGQEDLDRGTQAGGVAGADFPGQSGKAIPDGEGNWLVAMGANALSPDQLRPGSHVRSPAASFRTDSGAPCGLGVIPLIGDSMERIPADTSLEKVSPERLRKVVRASFAGTMGE